MSEIRKRGAHRTRVMSMSAGVGAAVVAIGLMSTGAAHADTFVPLPDGQKAGPGAVV
ncbi:MspA family porin, partial [Rhodococcus sp. NPDC055112]